MTSSSKQAAEACEFSGLEVTSRTVPKVTAQEYLRGLTPWQPEGTIPASSYSVQEQDRFN